MRQKLRYLCLELKKTAGIFPRMLLQAILLMVIIGMIAFCGVKVMEREPLAVSADIGVVVREDNVMTRLALGYVENMESVSELCHFVQVSETEGRRMLERGDVIALVVMPEQLVEGVMDGSNPSVDIIFPKDAQLEAMLFRELTESGEGLLRVAQAQIYGAVDMAAEFGLTDDLSVMEAEIDSYNLAFALDRFAIYAKETVSATGRLNLWQFYAASGLILFLFLAGMALYPVMQKEPKAFADQLIRQGTGAAWQCFGKWFCGFVCLLVFGAVVWLAANLAADIGFHAPLRSGAGSIMFMLITVFTAANVSAFVFMIYSIAGSRTGGILSVFLSALTMAYLSGGLIPAAFLPRAVQTIGNILPTAYLLSAVRGLMTGYRDGALGQCAGGMCMYTAVFGAAAYAFWRRK